jgi:hypothetical protein
VDEADAVEHRALDDIVRREEAVDVVGPQVGDHLGRRNDAQLNVTVGVDAVFGQVVAQQIVVVRIVEGDRELQSLPRRRVAPVLVLQGEANGLAVDVLDRRNRERHRGRSQAHRNGDRHRCQHVRGVVFLVHRLVAHHRPARGLDDFDVEALLGVEAERRRHDDGRGTSNRDEADGELLLLEGRALGKCFGRGHDREDFSERGGCGGTTHGPQEGAPRLRLGHDRAQKSVLDAGLEALLRG